MPKKVLPDQIWLNYFNQYLYEKGIISENERNKMSNKISNENFYNKDKRDRDVIV